LPFGTVAGRVSRRRRTDGRRRYVLGGALVAAAALAAAILADVLWTVFFAVTVGYLLSPLRGRLVDRGLSRWWASAVATGAAFVASVAAAAPLAVVLFVRLESLLGALSEIPREVTLELFGFPYTLTLERGLELLQQLATSLAATVLTVAPVLLIKFTLFALLVFSILFNEERVREAVVAVTPRGYRNVLRRLDRRTRETLFAIYVLQAATAAGTFLIAVPVFFLLGYDVPVTLATVAAVLQFVPIVGPSLLLVGLAAFHVALSQVAKAVVVLVVGGALIAWLPDVLIRPRLADATAHLPGGLYFTGFVGGLLTLGPVGVIAGPLAVALVLELGAILSSELNDIPVEEA
jgi:predicted PurR-regulated permease PerM